MMWDGPRRRSKSYRAAASRAQKTHEIKRQARSQIHLKRTEAEIRISHGNALSFRTIHARLILNDFTKIGISLFSADPVPAGSIVSVAIQKPTSFFARGRVVGCYLLPQETIILSDLQYNYRCIIRFEFQNEVERYAVSEYCKTLYQANAA